MQQAWWDTGWEEISWTTECSLLQSRAIAHPKRSTGGWSGGGNLPSIKGNLAPTQAEAHGAGQDTIIQTPGETVQLEAWKQRLCRGSAQGVGKNSSYLLEWQQHELLRLGHLHEMLEDVLVG